MKRRLLNLLAVLSLLLAVATAVVWVISYPCYRPGFVDLSWSSGPGGAGWDNESGRLVLWAGDVGGIKGVAALRVTEWHVPGVDYHRVTGPNPSMVVAVSHGIVLATLLVLPAVALRRERRVRLELRRASASLCPRCGYDVRATPGQCPECGAAATTPEPRPVPPRRVFHRLPRRAQTVCRLAVLLAPAGAVILLAPPLIAIAAGRPFQWERRAANTRSASGFTGGHYHLIRTRQLPGAGPGPGETAVASAGRALGQGSFWVGGWSHSQRDHLYTNGPAATDYTPEQLAQFRRAADEERKDYWVDPWRCAGILLTLPGFVVLNALRRYVAHGYWFAGRIQTESGK